MTRFVVVPQWQGSPSSRAMQLIDGAEAIAGDLPRTATTVLEVPMEAGESLGTGILRLSTLQRIHALLADALSADDEPTLTIGGDCGVALAPIAASVRRVPDVALVWLDAHADFNTPETSPSGAFSGMVLRAVLGEGDPALVLPAGAVTAERTVIGGARALDDAEQAALAESGIRMLAADALRDADALAEAVAATGAHAVHVHIDLDVLDPSEIAGTSTAEPFGITVAELTAALAALRARVPLAGASIAGYSPASADAAADDLGTILRIVGALA